MNEPTEYVTFKGNVSNRVEAGPLIPNAGEYVIVLRGHPRWLVLRCPSKCGELVSINLDRGAGAAWRFYKRKKGLSLYPSVVRETGCHSHFIVWNDRIIWCGSDDTYDPYWDGTDAVTEEMKHALLSIVQRERSVHYSDIAEELKEVPWQVLRACKTLTKEGLLTEGAGRNQGIFTMGDRR
jgi:hypothetical protein